MNKNSWCFSRTKFLPRIIVGVVVFLASATFTRLSPAQTRSRVIVAHGVGIYSLNPYAVNTSPLTAAWGSVMESLIEPDYEKRGYRGVLAESWQLKGTRLEFKLRKGVRFHDGSPFTAADVVASFKRILTDKNSLQSPNLENVKDMEAPDPHTVVINLKRLDANILEDINNRVVMKQAAAEKMGEADDRPIGTGPFKFTSWERSGQFVIRRNATYWGQPAKIDEVVYKSCTSGKAGGLNCEPLKAVWPATPACVLLEHL